MNDWKTMDTAPKDGTSVLLYYADHGIIISRYRVHETLENGVSKHRIEGWVYPWPLWSGENPEPIRWMPLPEPPT